MKGFSIFNRKTLEGDSSYEILNHALVSKDALVLDDSKQVAYNINEYIWDRAWRKKRLRTCKDLCFKNNYAEILDDLDKIGLDIELESATSSPDSVFVYDYPWGYNYQHWMITSVTRISQYLKIKKDSPEIKLLMLDDGLSYKLELIELLGVKKADIIILNELTRYQKVIVPSFNSCSGRFVSHEAIDLMSGLTKYQQGGLERKVYITRDDSNGKRPVSNRSDLDSLMKEHGFECVRLENMNMKDKIRLFSEAKVVIGDFSAGFCHSLFMSPGSTLILIEHDSFKFSTFYENITSKKGITFRSINGSNWLSSVFHRALGIIYRKLKIDDDYANSHSWSIDLRRVKPELKRHD